MDVAFERMMTEGSEQESDAVVDTFADIDQAEEELRSLGSAMPIGIILVCTVVWITITSFFDGYWQFILSEHGTGGLIVAGLALASPVVGVGVAGKVYLRRARRVRELRDRSNAELLAQRTKDLPSSQS